MSAAGEQADRDFEPRPLLSDALALAEAARCQGCLDGACRLGCPLEVDVGGFVRRMTTGNAAGAFRVLRSANPMPETTALVCPSEQLCQGRCAAAHLGHAVRINLLQRYAAHHGSRQERIAAGTSAARVAVVGTGPAGLACVDGLMQRGIAAEVFEASDGVGGALARWIPPYRLPRDVVDREAADILGDGTTVHLGQRLGVDVSLDGLLDCGFDAVFVGTGLPAGVDVGLPGREGAGVVEALDYLARHATDDDGPTPDRVVVVGGGNTAIDAAAVAKLNGATDVYLVYRRSFGQMPAWRKERQLAIDLGVHVLILVNPVGYERDGDGRLVGLRCVRTELGEPAADGRRQPVEVPGSDFVLPAGLVVEAMGQQLDGPLRTALAGLRFESDGALWTDPKTCATSRTGVFAGGDLTNREHTVVHALADGLRGAEGIAAYVAAGC